MMIHSYRKKPVVVQALLFTKDTRVEDLKSIGVAHEQDTGFAVTYDNRLPIHTPEGVMYARIGDYIIRGVNGEVSPCKPDIFHKTYEMVE